MAAFILMAVGAVNWLLLAVSGWEIGQLLGGTLAQGLYIIFGLAAIYEVVMHKKNCRQCNP